MDIEVQPGLVVVVQVRGDIGLNYEDGSTNRLAALHGILHL